MSTTAPSVQEVLELIEKLPEEDKDLVIEIARHRLAAERRQTLLAEVAEARADYKAGDVQRGSVEELLAELDE